MSSICFSAHTTSSYSEAYCWLSSAAERPHLGQRPPLTLPRGSAPFFKWTLFILLWTLHIGVMTEDHRWEPASVE